MCYYAITLYKAGATLNDIRDAVTTLEDWHQSRGAAS